MPFKNKEDKAGYFKAWREKNPNAGKERMGKWCENNPEKRLFRGAKARAKKKGHEFNLVLEDIVIPTHCPYLGVKLDFYSPREEGNKYVASLDRIDSTDRNNRLRRSPG